MNPSLRQPPPDQARSVPLVAPATVGFVVLLALLFAVSYAVGSAVGPVAPGMHRTGGG